MFISTSEIGYLTSCYMCMIWLNWSLKFHTIDYGLIYTWYPHKTHKSNVQWIFISFVWLYVFKCDVCMFNCLMIQPNFFFSILFVSGSDFCHFGVESFYQNVKIFVWKNFVFGHFVTAFVSGSTSRYF